MQIVKDVNPDFLAGINKASTIVICTSPLDESTVKESEDFPDVMELFLARDINLSTDIIRMTVDTFIAKIYPKIKICMPAGIKIQFSDIIKKHTDDVFWKIYKSYNISSVYKDGGEIFYYNLDNFEFTLYIDSARLRELQHSSIITKGSKFAEFYFTWYIQSSGNVPQIENIYLISDQQVYEDFDKIF